MKRIFLVLTMSLLALSVAGADGLFKVPPSEYRAWNHVKSMVIYDKTHPLYNPFNGIHHVYVNERGVNTIKRQGKREFPEGTKIAIVFYQHEPANGAYVEGQKRLEAFMVKNSKKYSSTDGWGYYAYDAQGNPIVKDMKADCHNCHSQVSEQDFVFSVWTK